MEQTVKRPVAVTIIAWLSLFLGVLVVLGGVLLLNLGIYPSHSTLLIGGIMRLLIGIIYVVSFFGLMRMRKWSLYLLTFSILVNLVSQGLLVFDLANILETTIEIVIVIYLWFIRKKFT